MRHTIRVATVSVAITAAAFAGIAPASADTGSSDVWRVIQQLLVSGSADSCQFGSSDAPGCMFP